MRFPRFNPARAFQIFLSAALLGVCPFTAHAQIQPGFDAYAVEIDLKVQIGTTDYDIRTTGQATAHRANAIPIIVTTTLAINVDLFNFDTTGKLGEFDVRVRSDSGAGQIIKMPSAGPWNVDSFFDITYRIDFTGMPGGPLHTAAPARVQTITHTTGIPFADIPAAITETTPLQAFTRLHSGPLSVPLLNDSGDPVGTLQSVSYRLYPWIYCYPIFCNLAYARLAPGGQPGTAATTGNSRISHGCYFFEGGISQEIQNTSASGNGVEIRESPSRPSMGRIQSNLNDFPAESFFDVFFEVTIDGIPSFNKDPLHLQSFPNGVNSLPFNNVQHFGTNCPINLYAASNREGPPIFQITDILYVPSIPIRWWIPYYSCYIVKLTPFCLPLFNIPFSLFSGFGAAGSSIATGMTNDQGYLDFQNLAVGKYSVKEDVPQGYTPVTDPLQDVDLSTGNYAQDFYGTLDGRGFGGGPPALQGDDSLQLGMSFELDVNGSTETIHVQGPSTVRRESPTLPPVGGSFFDTEMLSMSLQGGPSMLMPGGPVMIRESPTLPSLGRFQQIDPTGPFYPCDSFFDVFFEVSFDGGANWYPSSSSAHVGDPSVKAYPPNNEMFNGPPSDVLIQHPTTHATVARIRKWWWWWLPWYEYYIPYINIPPTPTPIPSSTPTASSTSTSSPSATSTATGTATATGTRTGTATTTNTATDSPTPSFTKTVTNTNTPRPPTDTPTPTLTRTPTNTATFTRTVTNTNTPRPPTNTPTSTRTHTRTSTATPTDTKIPTPTVTDTRPPGQKPLIYSIERDTLYNGGASIALEGDVLIGGTLSTILGGKYEDLLVPFLKDPPAEGHDLGLDALDAISIQSGVLTRVFFSVERPFTVTNPAHPLFGLMVSDGDLITKSGLVIPNAMIRAPFDLQSTTGVPLGDIGFDGVDVEGVTGADYDAWTNSFYSSGGNPAPPTAILDVLRIYWSFEELPTGPSGLGTSYTTGAFAALPVGPGVPVSEDDVLDTNLVTGGARVFRVGADGIPAGVPLILGGLFNPAFNPPSVGLDALDMPNYLTPFEADEAGETGPVGILQDTVLFSTEIDDPVLPNRFGHGDLLADPPVGSSYVEKTNAMLTGNPQVGDVGLDGVDCLGDVYMIPVTRSNPCLRVFLPQNVNNVGLTPGSLFEVQVRALRGCEIQQTLRFQFQFSSFFFMFIGADPGPNFMVMKADKGPGMTEPIVEIERTGAGEPGELLATLHFSTQVFAGNGTINWLQFELDGGGNVAGDVPPVEVSTAEPPSKPVLTLPDPITSSSVQANWFANPVIENVTAYTASVRSATGVVAEETVGGASTTALLSFLAPGTSYTLRLIATNSAGDSEPAELLFKTRFDPLNPDITNMLIQLGVDWTPSGGSGGNDLQSSVPSPVDINLDGLVNSDDAVSVLEIQTDSQ